MSTRITNADLNGVVARLNRITKSPETYSTETATGGFRADIGHYHIDSAYGGVKLVRTINTSGGERSVSTQGYGTKRELYEWVQTFISGIDYGQA